MAYKRFRFTIQGDDFDPEIVKEMTGIPCEIFKKDDVIVKHYITKRELKQKTNRWVYVNEAFKHDRIDGFLTRSLQIICHNLSILKPFIDLYDCSMEVVIYAGDKTNININRKQIELLNKIGIGLDISFS